ncbi:hypothetical protein [Marinomonas sp. TW1]|uniref:hypothetical protein n=1 Tax=Marinomonas sp. TW1 TaxID=1561203 RepID=UPI0007AF1A51|nr:hypothetical protein [Marinomonas sp. TW1]KZN13050.1 hypothetical protein OA79_12925 [Marinomonas sp. TW1]
MKHIFNQIVKQTLDQVEDSPLKNALGEALTSSLTKQQDTLSALLQAKQEGVISQEELDMELNREKDILEAEMLTKQIAAKAEVQKLVNDAIQSLSKGLL